MANTSLIQSDPFCYFPAVCGPISHLMLNRNCTSLVDFSTFRKSTLSTYSFVCCLKTFFGFAFRRLANSCRRDWRSCFCRDQCLLGAVSGETFGSYWTTLLSLLSGASFHSEKNMDHCVLVELLHDLCHPTSRSCSSYQAITRPKSGCLPPTPKF